MGRWTAARWVYAGAALAVGAAAALYLSSGTYVCSDAESGGSYSCYDSTPAEMLTRMIVGAIGLGFAVFFVVKAVRARRPR